MKLGIPLYEDVNLLDVAGPLQMFYWASQKTPLETVLVSKDGHGVTSINGVRFEAQANFAEVPAFDILWAPGGSTTALQNIMLARAGLLEGYTATTHWVFVKCLQRLPEIDVDTERKRFLVSENRLTGGGVSSGLDESLELIRLPFGEETAKYSVVACTAFPKASGDRRTAC
jgi:transcriptional regulator GlxA family with amidase domain